LQATLVSGHLCKHIVNQLIGFDVEKRVIELSFQNHDLVIEVVSTKVLEKIVAPNNFCSYFLAEKIGAVIAISK
jgi:hypothetical protein